MRGGYAHAVSEGFRDVLALAFSGPTLEQYCGESGVQGSRRTKRSSIGWVTSVIPCLVR